MGCALVWKPVKKKSYRAGSYQLRDILEKKYGYPSELEDSNIPYLEALIDSGVEGADDLVEAIRKYEIINIELEC